MTTINQTKLLAKNGEKPSTLTQIELGTFSKDKAENIKEKIESKSGFMKFEVIVCPTGGQFNVIVQTTYKAKKDEILGQFMWLMATLI